LHKGIYGGKLAISSSFSYTFLFPSRNFVIKNWTKKNQFKWLKCNNFISDMGPRIIVRVPRKEGNHPKLFKFQNIRPELNSPKNNRTDDKIKCRLNQ
jgi:hypothetical protein